MAVFASGDAATFDGTAWSQPVQVDPVSNGGGLSAVSCPSASFCMAVANQSPSVFIFNGSSWGSATNLTDSVNNGNVGMTTVSCASPGFCAAIDDDSNAFMFNGTSWSGATTVDSSYVMSTVSCPAAGFCVAVDAGDMAVTFNGTSWSKPSVIDPGGSLDAVSCLSASFCAAIDNQGNAVTFDGTSWSAPVTADPGGLSLQSGGYGGIGNTLLSCPSSSFCAAVDGGGNVTTFNGSSWSAPVNITSYANSYEPGSSLSLVSVSCTSATFCVAGDMAGDVFTLG